MTGDIEEMTRSAGFVVGLTGLWIGLCGCGGAPASTASASDPSSTNSASSTSSTGGPGEGSAAGPTSTAEASASASVGSDAGTTDDVRTTGDAVTTGTEAPTSTGEASTGADDRPRPELPRGLKSYLSGDPEDADVQPDGPGLIVMGGSTDVDAAFTWQLKYVGGGDLVVLRAAGGDGYNDYLYQQIGGVNSVETLIVDSVALANEPYVAWTIAHAEAVFIAGGDQAKYLKAWKGTATQDALMKVWTRGGVIGGTSAGAAVLGELIYAAYNNSVIEDEALLDPYNKYMSFEREFLALPPLAGVITDTHFTTRRRLCRLIGFVARMVQDGWGEPVLGVGVDEATALVVDPAGLGTVLGLGKVHLLRSAGAPAQCAPGLSLEYAGLEWQALGLGDTVQLPAGTAPGASTALSASMGALNPAYSCVQ